MSQSDGVLSSAYDAENIISVVKSLFGFLQFTSSPENHILGADVQLSLSDEDYKSTEHTLELLWDLRFEIVARFLYSHFL
jgi:hypothetical protein